MYQSGVLVISNGNGTWAKAEKETYFWRCIGRCSEARGRLGPRTKIWGNPGVRGLKREQSQRQPGAWAALTLLASGCRFGVLGTSPHCPCPSSGVKGLGGCLETALPRAAVACPSRAAALSGFYSGMRVSAFLRSSPRREIFPSEKSSRCCLGKEEKKRKSQQNF